MSALIDLAAEFVTDITQLIGKYVLRIAAPFIAIKQRSASLFSTLVTLWMKLWAFGIVSIIALIAIAISAITMYGVLYVWMMPPLEHVAPVYFDFSTPHPTAHINLLDEHYIYRYDTTTTDTRTSYLYPGQAYDFDLRMNVPKENAKKPMGMITVYTAVYHHQRLLSNASRPFMSSAVQILTPPPPSSSLPIRFIRSLLAIPLWFIPSIFLYPFISTPVEPTSYVQLQCMEFFQEDGNYPASIIRLELRSKHIDEYQMHDARLIIKVQLLGIRYWMYHWFYTTAFILITLIMGTELFWISLVASLIYIKCCAERKSPRNSFSVSRSSYGRPLVSSTDESDDDDDDDDDENENEIATTTRPAPFRPAYMTQPLPQTQPPSYTAATSTTAFPGRGFRLQETDENYAVGSSSTTSPPVRQRRTRLVATRTKKAEPSVEADATTSSSTTTTSATTTATSQPHTHTD